MTTVYGKRLAELLAIATVLGCLGACTPNLSVVNTETSPSLSPSPSASVDALATGDGRLVIDTPDLDYFTYGPVHEWSLETKSEKSELVLPKGDYTVTVFLRDATIYTATVTVNGGMQTTTVKPVTKSSPVELIAEGVYADNFLPAGDGRYFTYDSESKSLSQISEGADPLLQTPLKLVDQACHLSSDQILFVGEQNKAFLLDTATGDFTPFTPKGVRWDALELDSSRCVDGAVQFTSDDSLTQVGLDTAETVKLPNSSEIAYGVGQNFVADISDNAIAVVVLVDDAQTGESEDIEEAHGKLVITDRATSAQKEVDLGTSEYFFNVSFAPDGSKVAVLDRWFVSVYDTVTAELLYAVPAGSTQIHWLDSNSFIHQDVYDYGYNGFSLTDVAKRESYSLIKTDQLVTVNSRVIGGYLYFTGHPEAEYGEEYSGYRVSLI